VQPHPQEVLEFQRINSRKLKIAKFLDLTSTRARIQVMPIDKPIKVEIHKKWLYFAWLVNQGSKLSFLMVY